jgi:hypothetical protein
MDTEKILKGTAIGLVGLGLGFAGGSMLMPQEKIVEIEKNVTVTKEVLVPFEVIKNVTVIKEVPVDFPVDNGNLKLVLEHIYDNNGNINYITDDLEDDELNSIVERIVFVNELKSLAVNAIQKDLFDEVDKMIVNGTTLDEDDLKSLKINDEADEIEIDEIDFEDKDAELILTGTFRQDDEKFDFEAKVIFREGEYDELDVLTVTKQ